MNASSVFLSATMLTTCVFYGLYVVFCKPNTVRRSVFAIAYLIDAVVAVLADFAVSLFHAILPFFCGCVKCCFVTACSCF